MTSPLRQLQLSGDEITELGAGRCPDALLARLEAGQRLRRLLALRSIRQQLAEEDHGRAIAVMVDEAFTAMHQLERESPAAMERLVMWPLFGAWCERALDLLRREAPVDDLAAHLARLAPAVLAAAASASTSVELSITPGRGDEVILPGLGVLHLSDGPRRPLSGIAGRGRLEIRGSGARFRITVTDDGRRGVLDGGMTGMAWQPTFRLSAEASEHRIDVDLEDRDPLRMLGYDESSFATLDAGARSRWSTCIEDAWALLVEDHPDHARPMAVALRTMVPRSSGEASRSVSATSADTFGLIAMTEPTDGVAMAVTLVHEFQHAKLGALLDLQPLTAPSGRQYYAPWRDDPRPVNGFLQGIFAFIGITQFWARQVRVTPYTDRMLAEFEFARNREQVRLALDQIGEGGELTVDGEHFLEGLREALSEIDATDVDRARLMLAVDVCTDHRARWRIRHLNEAGDLRARDDQVATNDDGVLLRLAYLAYRSPDRFEAMAADDAVLPDLRPSRADLDFVAGRIGPAAASYAERLTAVPGEAGARIGLGLCLRRLGRQAAAGVLLDHPERSPSESDAASIVQGMQHVLDTPFATS